MVACRATDAAHVEEQLRAYFPDAVVSDSTGFLVDQWHASDGSSVVIDFGLSQEFMRPLKTFSRFDADPLRVAAKSPTPSRAWQIAKRMGGALAQVGTPSSNELIALANDEYPDDMHLDDPRAQSSLG